MFLSNSNGHLVFRVVMSLLWMAAVLAVTTFLVSFFAGVAFYFSAMRTLHDPTGQPTPGILVRPESLPVSGH